MSKTGWWGDKIIFVLTTDDERRHKNWCEFYNKDKGVCTKSEAKCHGSAFCQEYEKREGVGVIAHNEIAYIPSDVPKYSYLPLSKEILEEPITKEIFGKPVSPEIPKYISNLAPCHRLSYVDKPVGKVVIVDMVSRLAFGVVKSFSNVNSLIIEFDDGSVKNYVTKNAVRSNRIFVVDDIREAAETMA